MKKPLVHVVGARPNFMKAAPLVASLSSEVDQILVHTGQHYDRNMSEVFFSELSLPEPDVNLGVGGGSHSYQTAEIMKRLDTWFEANRVDKVVVYGDVNSTVAAALVCAKCSISLVHVEAGLRSFDRTMPEEVNRLVTDQLADVLLTPSADADENLMREGISGDKIFLVGNVMIDTLTRLRSSALARWENLASSFPRGDFGLITLHRPSNVDDPGRLELISEALREISSDIPLVFPMHPRTRQRLNDLGQSSSLIVMEPQGYLDFLALQSHAKFVITDSGGVQEESTYLGIPCLTLRPNTERPITVQVGTNTVVGEEPSQLVDEVKRILDGKGKVGQIPPLWDGQTANRMAAVLLDTY
jgi:UDP-N-acetylglucosamine 2-epimerase (non-hydrolysing)